MLTITDFQMAVFRRRSEQSFTEQMLEHIASEFPETYRELGEAGARRFVEEATVKAESHRVHAQGAVAMLIDLMLDFGKDFERSPDRAWANRILGHPSLPDIVKLQAIHDRMTARTEGRHIVPPRSPAAATEAEAA